MSIKKFILLSVTCSFLACGKDNDPAPGPGDPNDPGNPAKPVTITAVSPDKGDAATNTITITGTGFNSTASGNQVVFNNMQAEIVSATTTQVVVKLPIGITGGDYDITVKALGKTGSKTKAFYFIDWIVSTLAGTGQFGSGNGPGNQASFNNPGGIIADATGNLYVVDAHRVRKITPQGEVSNYAGRGLRGKDDGSLIEATFNSPSALAMDAAGNMYVADYFNHLIRKISTAGMVTTIAGNGTMGDANGIGTNASFNLPYGVAVNPQGTVLYVGDYNNHRIRKIDLATREVSNYAGNGTNASTDGARLNAGIPGPGGLHLDNAGNLYVTEKSWGKVRKITPAGEVSTIGGSFNVNTVPTHLITDQEENVYVSFSGMNVIKRFTKTGVESNFFGNLNSGDANGPASKAGFFFPEGITMVPGANGSMIFYICDTNNRKIKKIVKQ